MGSRAVDAPRRLFEIRPKRPDNFTVIRRINYDASSGRRSQHNLGKRYAVCPECAWRFALWGEPVQVRCPTCGHRGEVAWWE
jgi:predicted Zn-ribbon and HTH transcriptional regulator